jgi:hypothetical protein
MADAKFDQLADKIVAKLSQELSKNFTLVPNREFTALVTSHEELKQICNAIFARDASCESVIGGGGSSSGSGSGAVGTAVKRSVRPGSAAKKSAAAKVDAPKIPANALLLFRQLMADNTDGIREKFATPEALERAARDKTVANKDRVKDEVGFFKAAGSVIWKGLSAEDKRTYQNQYKEMSEQAKADSRPSQLEPDAPGLPFEEEEPAEDE